MRRPMFRADWEKAVFIHFAIDPKVLAPHVPFELDIRDGRAFVSLVAFTQNHLRPTIGGRLAAALSTPLARHEFMNLRTYVRVNGQPAIYFMSEWIPNRLAVLIGPRLYGLPYQWGTLRYRHETPALSGGVTAPAGEIAYAAKIEPGTLFAPTTEGTLDHFLLERYAAFTHRDGVSRRFDVDHEPWLQTSIGVTLIDYSLLDTVGEWTHELELIGGNYSPGVCDVGISAPTRLELIPSVGRTFLSAMGRWTHRPLFGATA
jgi:uncharacterized protein YqjF (DUF2071 family)